MTRPEFEALAADYYDARDSEDLTHESIAEAVEEYLDCFIDRDREPIDAIREHAPIEVTAFRRRSVDGGWIEGTARTCLEHAAEAWGEEYGDPDGGDEFDEADYDRALPAMAAVLRDFLDKDGPTVWACSPVGKYSYSAEEVEAMMRAHRPDWFDAAPEDRP